MKKVISILKKIILVIAALVVVMIAGLWIYSMDSYEPLEKMHEAIDQIDQAYIKTEDFNEITFTVDEPKMHILFLPGGKVEPESYEYLAISLAIDGYNVTIAKPLFNLAILTPNYFNRFLSETMDNVVIGHSLGGTVGSMISSSNELVSHVVFLASYPIYDVSDKEVLIITAENDSVLDSSKIEENIDFLGENHQNIEINGGNHAQFGWYGDQKGDGQATIDTITQQDLIITEIISFISD